MNHIQHILIANRGEIAERVIRTAHKMGIRTLALFSDADAALPYVAQADTAVRLPGNSPTATYLNQELIIQIARDHGVDAIHPGYGFLSERAAFAAKVRQAGITYIGPHTDAIAKMGSKSEAKALMMAHQVPVIPGYNGTQQDITTLIQEGKRIGFPLLIKAVAGGGGKGMRIVQEPQQLSTELEGARREAEAAFGNGDLLLERYFESARHIEFQIFGDQHGNIVHLLERECTIQRRYQKIMEESPSPVLSDQDRSLMSAAALQAAAALKYDNAGTVEFIYIAPEEFYFLEVNTRLQVEHPVTEAITGLDLVEWQLLAAEGAVLPLAQDDITSSGYAIQFRLYAEDAANNFMPSGGPVHLWDQPVLPGVRCDVSVQSGVAVSNYYDPMIAKIIVHGTIRNQALRKMRYTLRNLCCLGLTTNKNLLLGLLQHTDIINGKYDTQFLQHNSPNTIMIHASAKEKKEAAVACLVFDWQIRQKNDSPLTHIPGGWRNNFYQGQKVTYHIDNSTFHFAYRQEGQSIHLLSDKGHQNIRNVMITNNQMTFEWDGTTHKVWLIKTNDQYWVQLASGIALSCNQADRYPIPESETTSSQYLSPMPGQIIAVSVTAGQMIQEGEPLLILSSMKMEHTIHATGGGRVREVLVTTGDQIDRGTLLIQLENQESDDAV